MRTSTLKKQVPSRLHTRVESPYQVEKASPYAIEKGVSLPKFERSKKYNFGFDRPDFKVGDAIFIPQPSDIGIESHRQNIIRYAEKQKQVSGGEFAYTLHKADKQGVSGFRIYRIEA